MTKHLVLISTVLLLFACATKQPATKKLTNRKVKVSFAKQNTIALLSYSDKQISISTKIPKGFDLDEHNIIEVNNTILFYYQFADYESAGSSIIAFDKTEAKKLWRKDLQSFNIDAPLYNQNETYISAAGLLIKFKTRTGQILWKIDSFQKDFNFTDIEKVEKKGRNIIVNDDFVFSDSTGKFIPEDEYKGES